MTSTRLRERLRSLGREAKLQRGRGERQQRSTGKRRRERGPAQDAVDDRAPDPTFPVVAAEAADERDAPAVDLVPEPGEQGGKNGQRPEHRDGDDEDRGQGERGEGLVAGEEHAGHRHHHGQAGDEHRAAGRRGRNFQRLPLAAPRGAFLPLALQVEHRVVDAHGEPDQEHHRRGLHRNRQDDARERDEPEGREHGGQSEQERNARRDEGAEREHEDDQGDREREHSRLAEVLLVGGHDSLLSTRVAELADREGRMGALGGSDGVEDRADLVDRLLLVAADRELDEGGTAILRDLARVRGVERRADVTDGRHLRDARDNVRDRRIEGGRADTLRSDSGSGRSPRRAA